MIRFWFVMFNRSRFSALLFTIFVVAVSRHLWNECEQFSYSVKSWMKLILISYLCILRNGETETRSFQIACTLLILFLFNIILHYSEISVTNLSIQNLSVNGGLTTACLTMSIVNLRVHLYKSIYIQKYCMCKIVAQ